jgi:uncharacterized protein (TIGR03382 family)
MAGGARKRIFSPPGAAAGSYLVTVTGTEGSMVHATTVTAAVSAPAPAPSGKSGCSTAGSSAGLLLPLLGALLLRRRRDGR